jgi:hypothetical protein
MASLMALKTITLFFLAVEIYELILQKKMPLD